MRHGTTNRRSRGRNNNNRGNGGGNNRAQVFDSNGPDVRIRGTAHQICEKYEALAKDCLSVGDMVMAESYLQHAEHYQRMIVMWNEQSQANSQQQQSSQERNSRDAEGNSQQAPQAKKAQNDDLALPASILGEEVKAASQQGVRASQSVLEDA